MHREAYCLVLFSLVGFGSVRIRHGRRFQAEPKCQKAVTPHSLRLHRRRKL